MHLHMEVGPRHQLNEEVRHLEQLLLEMASLAERMVSESVDSLVHLDHDRAMAAIQLDDEIDQRDLEVETLCMKLLALRQPTATDLRTIGTIMKMITDIERIGDLAVDIAKTGMKIEKELGNPTIVDIPRIAAVCRYMFRQSIEAFVKRDVEIVHEVVQRDDDVDQLYRELRDQIHEHMRQDPDAVVSDSWLLLAVHHLERVADHSVNIAERVNYMVTGQMAQLAPSHQTDSTSS